MSLHFRMLFMCFFWKMWSFFVDVIMIVMSEKCATARYTCCAEEKSTNSYTERGEKTRRKKKKKCIIFLPFSQQGINSCQLPTLKKKERRERLTLSLFGALRKCTQMHYCKSTKKAKKIFFCKVVETLQFLDNRENASRASSQIF